MSEHTVRLYALSTCGHCRNTKKFLEENNVPFTVEDVDLCDEERKQAIISEIRDSNPRLGFPMLFIDDKVIIGFKEDEIRTALEL